LPSERKARGSVPSSEKKKKKKKGYLSQTFPIIYLFRRSYKKCTQTKQKVKQVKRFCKHGEKWKPRSAAVQQARDHGKTNGLESNKLHNLYVQEDKKQN